MQVGSEERLDFHQSINGGSSRPGNPESVAEQVEDREWLRKQTLVSYIGTPKMAGGGLGLQNVS